MWAVITSNALLLVLVMYIPKILALRSNKDRAASIHRTVTTNTGNTHTLAQTNSGWGQSLSQLRRASDSFRRSSFASAGSQSDASFKDLFDQDVNEPMVPDHVVSGVAITGETTSTGALRPNKVVDAGQNGRQSFVEPLSSGSTCSVNTDPSADQTDKGAWLRVSGTASQAGSSIGGLLTASFSSDDLVSPPTVKADSDTTARSSNATAEDKSNDNSSAIVYI